MAVQHCNLENGIFLNVTKILAYHHLSEETQTVPVL